MFIQCLVEVKSRQLLHEFFNRGEENYLNFHCAFIDSSRKVLRHSGVRKYKKEQKRNDKKKEDITVIKSPLGEKNIKGGG